MDFSADSGLVVLERTPATLNALLRGLPDELTNADEGVGTWSPRAVVAHLVHTERRDWVQRAGLILAQGADRRFRPVERDAQGQEPMNFLLDQFGLLRADNLRRVNGWALDDAKLGLTGEHPVFGEVTLAQLLATWIAHDLSHLNQITRVMAKQYRDAVGPWRAYLRVMDR